eukprot:11325636-Karenia_brevis.AAC.1
MLLRTGLCVMWQCGYLGLRVGEASHPGPANDAIVVATQIDAEDSDSAASVMSDVPRNPFRVARLELCARAPGTEAADAMTPAD